MAADAVLRSGFGDPRKTGAADRILEPSAVGGEVGRSPGASAIW